MEINECAVRIKTKEELYELENICKKYGITWGSGDKHFDFSECYDKAVIFIDNFRLTHGSLEYYEDEYGSKLNLLSFKAFKNQYGEKMKIEECIVKIKDNDELQKLEDICFANNIGWSCGGKNHSSINVKATYDEFCVHVDNILSLCSLDYYKSNNGHLNFYTLSEFKKKYKTKTIKSQIRVKTEQEFIDEFGENWVYDGVHWNSGNNMDYLFGQTLNESDKHNSTLDNKIIYRVTDKNGETWDIYKNMIIPVTTIKRKKKLVNLITKNPEPVSLKNTLFKRKTIRLSTSD